jgi:hypothetical protein
MSYATGSTGPAGTSSFAEASNAARARKIACRVYGTLSVLLGLIGGAMGVCIVWARNLGGTMPPSFWEGMEVARESVPALYGPYALALSLVTVVLGVLIFRQSVSAAIVLLGVSALCSALSWFLAALNLTGVPASDIRSTAIAQAVIYAIMLIMTAVIVIADRAARGAQARR